jgi:hypothetical protein
MTVVQYDPPSLSTPTDPFPVPVTTGPLQPNDRMATDLELADALRALAAITNLTLDDIEATDHVREIVSQVPMDVEAAHEFFVDALRGPGGQSKAAYLHRALGQVGTIENPPMSNRTKYNSWFAGLYGSVYEACAWCAIFQSWTGIPGAIKPSQRSASAEALVYRFPDKGRLPGTLIYYTFSHVEVLVKNDGVDYSFTVGGNTGDNGEHTDGVWYVHRYMSGVVGHYGMPEYEVPTPPHDHLETNGKLAVTGVLGGYTINHLKRSLDHAFPSDKPLPLNGYLHRRTIRSLQKHLHIAQTGVCHVPTVKALQEHLHVKADGDWGPTTTKNLQRRLNIGTF